MRRFLSNSDKKHSLLRFLVDTYVFVFFAIMLSPFISAQEMQESIPNFLQFEQKSEIGQFKEVMFYDFCYSKVNDFGVGTPSLIEEKKISELAFPEVMPLKKQSASPKKSGEQLKNESPVIDTPIAIGDQEVAAAFEEKKGENPRKTTAISSKSEEINDSEDHFEMMKVPVFVVAKPMQKIANEVEMKANKDKKEQKTLQNKAKTDKHVEESQKKIEVEFFTVISALGKGLASPFSQWEMVKLTQQLADLSLALN